jgi:hypothetical protein
LEKVRADIRKQEDGVKRFETNTLTEKIFDFLPGQGKMRDREGESGTKEFSRFIDRSWSLSKNELAFLCDKVFP